MNGIIGGYVCGVGGTTTPLIPVFGPDLSTIERLVELFCEQDGMVVLRVLSESTPTAYELCLYAENGVFTLIFNMIVGDYREVLDILSLLPDLNFACVVAVGDTYPHRAVTRDFAIVRGVFRMIAERKISTMSQNAQRSRI